MRGSGLGRYLSRPSYSEPARQAIGQDHWHVGLRGTHLELQARQLRPVKMLGFGRKGVRSDQALEFKPATTDGAPVDMTVPVEVTFRMD